MVDQVRVGENSCLRAVRAILLEGQRLTGYELRSEVQRRTGELHSESGILARVRDLRKGQYGGHDIKKEMVPGSRSVYRYYVSGEPVQLDLEGVA